MYYRSGTDGRCSIGFVFTHQVAALCCMKWRHGRHFEIRLRQWMGIYLNNIPANFYPNPIWDDGALGFFEEVTPSRTTRRTKWVAIWDQFWIS